MTLAELVELLERMGSVPSEDMAGFTELDHGLQCADHLANRRPLDLELQVAGLVHDIGRQFGPDERHGELGADLVRPLLGERVAALVEAHVPAKRYLVTSDPAYARHLSSGSVVSLDVQGGPLSDGDAAAFLASPWFEEAVELRRADDDAKVPGAPVTGLERWLEPLDTVAKGAR